jgi:hypothetical protein
MNPVKDFKRLGRKNVMKHKNKETPSGYLRTAIKVLSLGGWGAGRGGVHKYNV